MTTTPVIEAIYGIDFSADAKNAGDFIWITEAASGGAGIRVNDCRSARDLLGLSSSKPEVVLPALVEFVASKRDAAFGCDFPFSLPAHLVQHSTWEDFLEAYPQRFTSPEAFRERCNQDNLAHCAKKEVQRATETRWKQCIPVNNLRMYKMTHFGIGSFLRPLVLEHGASVPPLTDGTSTGPLVLEVFGTGTCIDLCIDVTSSKQNPGKVLRRLESLRRVSFASGCLRDTVLGGPDHALDSVIAADAAYRAVSEPTGMSASRQSPYTIEGYIYA